MAQRFEDLAVWQKSRELTNAIYALTNGTEFGRDFGLRDQIRRAAVSVMSNIAEGFERGGDPEFARPWPRDRVVRCVASCILRTIRAM